MPVPSLGHDGPRGSKAPMTSRGARAALRIALGALAALVTLSGADCAFAQPFPACENPQNGQCAMSGSGAIMDGTVNVYTIFYGRFSGNVNVGIKNGLSLLLEDISDSSYERPFPRTTTVRGRRRVFFMTAIMFRIAHSRLAHR